MTIGQRYLVGGAVRDGLLGLAANDRDWVVIGTTPEAMIDAGYTPIGRDFPVFIHPQTHEEHALARTERKQGRGYRGFVTDASPDVTLSGDLARRDLTINAVAQAETGELIDPYGGQRDLADRILRHVTDAFAEDPVRILRVARYAARLAPLGFRVAPETRALMTKMVQRGEVNDLVAERVWAETRRALEADEPAVFFHVLRRCGALEVLFPELAALFGVIQPLRHHPEIDAGVHTLMVLDQTARAGGSTAARFAALCHDYGKALTPPHRLPGHRGHEEAGVTPTEACCKRLGVARKIADTATLAARWHTHIHRFERLRATTVIKLFEALDAFRRPERLDDLLVVCRADARGRLGFEYRPYPQTALVESAIAAARAVDAAAIARRCQHGPEIGDALRRARIAAVAGARQPSPK